MNEHDAFIEYLNKLSLSLRWSPDSWSLEEICEMVALFKNLSRSKVAKWSQEWLEDIDGDPDYTGKELVQMVLKNKLVFGSVRYEANS